MDFGSSTLAGISVGLELVTQYILLAIKLTHVIHTALEEGGGIHHTDTLPGIEKVHTVSHMVNVLLILLTPSSEARGTDSHTQGREVRMYQD